MQKVIFPRVSAKAGLETGLAGSGKAKLSLERKKLDPVLLCEDWKLCPQFYFYLVIGGGAGYMS